MRTGAAACCLIGVTARRVLHVRGSRLALLQNGHGLCPALQSIIRSRKADL